MHRHDRAPGARWTAWIAWLVALAACGISDRRFIEPPRLVAPMSMTAVTRQRPTLHWELGAGGSAPVVELCKDRACAAPIAIDIELAEDGQSAVPVADLPVGCVFWRVRVVRGGDSVASATWEFWVGHPHAEHPVAVDTGNGARLDVDGDGHVDLLVGASSAMVGGVAGGAAHLYLGAAGAAAGDWNGAAAARRIDLANPAGAGAVYGIAVASVGDVNGDGFADFLIGAPGADQAKGAAYLYFGSAVPSAADWNAGDSAARMELVSPDGPRATFGRVIGLGDVNGDGYADFLIADSPFGGIQPLHVYLGSAAPAAESWNGIAASQRIDLSIPDAVGTGIESVTGLGDVNGDGYADFAAATGGQDFREGKVHVYLGSSAVGPVGWNGDGASRRIDIASPDGPEGHFFWVAAAGDVNGDGYTDLVVGASGVDMGVGAAHVYLGAADPGAAWRGAAARIDLTSPDAGATSFGTVVASAGDVDGDGLSDLLLTSFRETFAPNAGTGHVYLGSPAPSAAAWNGASAPKRIDLVAPEGPPSSYGNTGLSTGDLDGDGYDDFAVGASAASGGAGAVYVYLGALAPSPVGWNAPAPGRRIDIIGPDPSGAMFGNLR